MLPAFSSLSREEGLKARAYALSGHVVGEAFFDGGWHMFDPDHRVFYRSEDGSIASVEELERNPALITEAPPLRSTLRRCVNELKAA